MKNRRQNRRVSSDWETPERDRLMSGGRKSSESCSDFESPLNSLRSPLRLESKRAFSEGKHRDRNLYQLRYRQGNTMPLKQKQIFSSEGNFEDRRSGDSQMDKHSIRNKEPVELTSPRTVSGATDWASIVEEEERNKVHEQSFRKRLELGQQHRQPRAQTNGHCEEAEGEAEADGLEEVEHPSSFETDSKVLERRQKQISYGVSTSEYQNYRKQVPLTKRTKFHPWTPDKSLKYSRRGWDTVIRIWRKQLHIWDPKPSDRKLCDQLPLDRTELKNCRGDSSVARDQDSFLDTGDVFDDDMTPADVGTVAVGELPESDCECLELDVSE